MKIPFVDIHTHHPKNSAEILSVESLFLQDAGSTRNVNFPFSAAIHPWHTGSYSLKQIEAMLEEVVKKPGLIAIGETGLDKSYKTDYQHQKQVFGLHLEFAQRHSKPLIIHAVRSWNEIIEYLKHSKTPSILHGYSAGVVLTKQLIGLGCYFSVGKPVLQITPRFRESLQIIPPTSLFMESDDSQVDIREIYSEVSKLRNITMEDLKIQVYENFKNLFRLR